MDFVIIPTLLKPAFSNTRMEGLIFFARIAMKIQRKSLFLFWAWMDLFFVLQFLWWNIAHRRLPFYDDLLAYLQLLHTWGSAAVWLYPLNVLLIISIPLSMILFFRQSRYGLWLAWGQAPLRLEMCIRDSADADVARQPRLAGGEDGIIGMTQRQLRL